jgi:hypothetical protein
MTFCCEESRGSQGVLTEKWISSFVPTVKKVQVKENKERRASSTTKHPILKEITSSAPC